MESILRRFWRLVWISKNNAKNGKKKVFLILSFHSFFISRKFFPISRTQNTNRPNRVSLFMVVTRTNGTNSPNGQFPMMCGLRMWDGWFKFRDCCRFFDLLGILNFGCEVFGIKRKLEKRENFCYQTYKYKQIMRLKKRKKEVPEKVQKCFLEALKCLILNDFSNSGF